MWNCGHLESVGRSLEPAVRSHVATPIESTCSLRPAIHMRRPPARQQSLSNLLLTQGWPSRSTSAGLSNAPASRTWPRCLPGGAPPGLVVALPSDGRHQAFGEAGVLGRPAHNHIAPSVEPLQVARRPDPKNSSSSSSASTHAGIDKTGHHPQGKMVITESGRITDSLTATASPARSR